MLTMLDISPRTPPSHGRGRKFDPCSAHHGGDEKAKTIQISGNVVRIFPDRDLGKSEQNRAETRHDWTCRGRGKRSQGVPGVPLTTLPDGLIFLYFVRVQDFIKIGVSRRWKRRINNINTASPFPVDVLLVEIARPDDEIHVHRKFRHLRQRGEWFRAEADLLAYVEARVGERDVSERDDFDAW